MAKKVPSYTGTLRSHSLMLPPCISECSGIRIFGRRIKSLAFSTDVAIIKNINADAIIAVYPFTPQPVIAQAIISVSDVPVFVGVGGGITTGQRSVRLAVQAEHQGAYGVVLNAPVPNEVIRQIKQEVDIPVVATVVSGHTDIRGRLEAGTDFLNVSGAAAGDRGGDPEGFPGCAHYCHRRPYGGDDFGYHSGGGQCGDLHAAHQRCAVCLHHGAAPQKFLKIGRM